MGLGFELGFACAKQALYHSSHTSSLQKYFFVIVFFESKSKYLAVSTTTTKKISGAPSHLKSLLGHE
jgi:hypothetical protein